MSKDLPPSRTADQFVVRFPEGMRDRIASEAKANNRSMNAEIVARLEMSVTGAESDMALKTLALQLAEANQLLALERANSYTRLMDAYLASSIAKNIIEFAASKGLAIPSDPEVAEVVEKIVEKRTAEVRGLPKNFSAALGDSLEQTTDMLVALKTEMDSLLNPKGDDSESKARQSLIDYLNENWPDDDYDAGIEGRKISLEEARALLRKEKKSKSR